MADLLHILWPHGLPDDSAIATITFPPRATDDPTPGPPRMRWFTGPHAPTAATNEAVNVSQVNVFFTVCAMPTNMSTTRKGDAASARWIPACWIDIDFAGESHAKPNLPSRAKGQQILKLITEHLPPTAVVNTGGGYHVYWALDSPVKLSGVGTAVVTAQVLPRMVQAAIKSLMPDVAMDSTHNLDRILRVPNTINRKDDGKLVCAKTSQSIDRPVVLEHVSDTRYTVQQLIDFCASRDITLKDTLAAVSRASSWHESPPDTRHTNHSTGRVADLSLHNEDPPPFVQRLCIADERFRATWAKDRPDLLDQSPSAYEMSIASQIARTFATISVDALADVVPQQTSLSPTMPTKQELAQAIARALCVWHPRYSKKPLHQVRLEKTIERAIESVRPEALEKLSDANDIIFSQAFQDALRKELSDNATPAHAADEPPRVANARLLRGGAPTVKHELLTKTQVYGQTQPPEDTTHLYTSQAWNSAREAAFIQASSLLNCGVTLRHIERHIGSERALFWFHLSFRDMDGTVRNVIANMGGIEEVISQARVRINIAEATQRLMPPLEKDTWTQLSQSFISFASSVKVAGPEDLHWHIRHYLLAHPPMPFCPKPSERATDKEREEYQRFLAHLWNAKPWFEFREYCDVPGGPPSGEYPAIVIFQQDFVSFIGTIGKGSLTKTSAQHIGSLMVTRHNAVVFERNRVYQPRPKDAGAGWKPSSRELGSWDIVGPHAEPFEDLLQSDAFGLQGGGPRGIHQVSKRPVVL